MKRKCPICSTESDYRLGSADEIHLSCGRCGKYCIEELTAVHLKSTDVSEVCRAALSHAVRQMAGRDREAKISGELLDSIIQSPRLPTPDEQAENLILLLGDVLVAPGRSSELDGLWLRAAIGALDYDGLEFILKATGDERLVDSTRNSLTLTYYGWRRYEELQRGRPDSTKAFMAMPFKSSQLKKVYRECFKTAVEETGFHLQRLDDRPPAGSIDDRQRVEIRTSRFLIAELTEGNPGVYWEAGFAEALGKPVIYTCRRDYYEKHGTHFDINHQHTIIWELDELRQARELLKNTIRATLPEQAIMEDPHDAGSTS